MKNFHEIAGELADGMGAFGRAHPSAMAGFGELMAATTGADGALDVRTKELIAFAIGIAARCDGCIAHHAKAVAAAGASREEVVEAIGVAIMMGGGPSVVYGTEALAAFDEFAGEPTFADGAEPLVGRVS